VSKLKSIWTDLNSSLWFIPGVIVMGNILLALTLIEIDKHVGSKWYSNHPRMFGVQPDGSGNMLATIAFLI
jgi:uncharacterized membrane protein